MDTPPPPAPSPAAPAPPKLVRHAPLARVLLLVLFVFTSLFLIVRTLALEPFGVPTGSMAPSLIGHHRAGPCPRCAYPVRVGRPTSGANEHYARVVCPNCEYGAHESHRFSLADARDLSGDRLLVDKNVYSLRAPRRWEMVVFRCPDPDPKEFGKPYVKRLIGLPSETIRVTDGDVYVNDEIARKGLAELRETLVPVFDMTYPPKGTGWAARWVASAGADPRLPAAGAKPPAAPDVVQGTEIVLDASDAPQAMVGATYRHLLLDEDQNAEQPVRVWNAYDGRPLNYRALPVARDFVLTCVVEVTATTTDEASFACRLMDGADAVSAEISVGPKGTGRAQLVHEGHGGLTSTAGVSLQPGRAVRVEFAFVDRRATLALDGKQIGPHADLPQVIRRPDHFARPLQLGARGCRVVVRELRLLRDTHYTHYGTHGTRQPVALGPREYYVLGDNSGNSQDSRKWPTPGVPEADFIGKPFLIHQPLRSGRVTVGGREREFQWLDWGRVRWLH